jgi:hypothetical protein
MAKSFIPDPLELLRQAVNRLEGRANTLAGRGMEFDQVLKALHQVSSLSLALRQAVEMALESAYKRLNLPTGREFAEMSATLQRLEDKLDSLLAAQVAAGGAASRPARTRKPASGAASAAAKPAPGTGRGRTAPTDAPRPKSSAARRRTAP